MGVPFVGFIDSLFILLHLITWILPSEGASGANFKLCEAASCYQYLHTLSFDHGSVVPSHLQHRPVHHVGMPGYILLALFHVSFLTL